MAPCASLYCKDQLIQSKRTTVRYQILALQSGVPTFACNKPHRCVEGPPLVLCSCVEPKKGPRIKVAG